MQFSVTRTGPEIGGLPAVSLNRAQDGSAEPQLLNVEILPGRGMNVFQIRAFLPGKGIVPLLESPSLDAAAQFMDGGPEDFLGNRSFTVGGALLIPYANRIGGDYSPAGRTVTVPMLGKPVVLPANWKDTALHGLILDRQFRIIRAEADGAGAAVRAELEAAFDGRWPSRTTLTVEAVLSRGAFDLTVTARNTGSEPEPMSIGWHPYFSLPGGNRAEARISIPARARVLVNNYEDMAATGEIVPVKGTPYDLSATGGVPLETMFLDDCFVDLDRNAGGEAIAEIIDAAAHYGMRMTAISPEIRAFQVYSPADSSFVAIEPQFNLLDPFSPAWPPEIDTGMVILHPGGSVVYRVRLELFRP